MSTCTTPRQRMLVFSQAAIAVAFLLPSCSEPTAEERDRAAWEAAADEHAAIANVMRAQRRHVIRSSDLPPPSIEEQQAFRRACRGVGLRLRSLAIPMDEVTEEVGTDREGAWVELELINVQRERYAEQVPLLCEDDVVISMCAGRCIPRWMDLEGTMDRARACAATRGIELLRVGDEDAECRHRGGTPEWLEEE